MMDEEVPAPPAKEALSESEKQEAKDQADPNDQFLEARG